MPWKETDAMSQRIEFVQLAAGDGLSRAELCRRFGIARGTGYKWLNRYDELGASGLQERSRRPKTSPTQTPPHIAQLIVELRSRHPAWGARKLRRRLEDLGHTGRPAHSTITDILRRAGLIREEEIAARGPWQRFEHPEPNDLWQMDFKGHFATESGRCHPLTVVDDHSRFNLILQACDDEKLPTVRGHLIEAFKRYGLPRRILSDNGRPWGAADHPYTQLSVWLLRLGIGISHGRAFHPQTQGKDERFNRTVKAEVIRGRWFRDNGEVQRHFDPWRQVYNRASYCHTSLCACHVETKLSWSWSCGPGVPLFGLLNDRVDRRAGEVLAIEDPGAIRQRMDERDLSAFHGQPQRLGADADQSRRLSEVHPALGLLAFRTMYRDTALAA
jgi:transposase InsO family protein